MLELGDMEDLGIKTDQEIAALSLRDGSNFSEIIKRYEPKLARYVRRLCSCRHEDIEDLLQEVFIKVYRNLNDFDTSLQFSSWIYRITHNEVISHYRKLRARPETLNISEFEIKSDGSFAKELDRKLDGEKIAQIFESLDIKYKEVLVLRFFEEKDYTEISDILRKPSGTVATLLNRAKKQFHERAKILNIIF